MVCSASYRTVCFFALGMILAVGLAPRSAFAQAESVKPGINKNFESPDPDDWAKRFERESREVSALRNEIVAACKIEPGMDVADVGAGTGLFTMLFAQKVGNEGHVYAVDIAKKFVDYVERTSKKNGLNNVVGVVCAMDDCGLKPNSVDAVFVCDTYHHFEFPYKTTRSIHRALRPGGTLIIVDFRRIEGVSSEWILGHVRAGQEVVRKEIEDVGFQFIDEQNLLKENYFIRFRKVAADKPNKG